MRRSDWLKKDDESLDKEFTAASVIKIMAYIKNIEDEALLDVDSGYLRDQIKRAKTACGSLLIAKDPKKFQNAVMRLGMALENINYVIGPNELDKAFTDGPNNNVDE